MARRKAVTPYSEEDIRAALHAIESGMLSSKAASKQYRYKIPRSTLISYRQGKSQIGVKPGRPTIPFEMEKAMVGKFVFASKAGFPITKQQLLCKVGRLVKSVKLTGTQFKHGVPSKEYWPSLKSSFLELTIRKPESCAANKLQAMRPEIVGNYFEELKLVMESLNLHDKPDRIWNCDETGLQFTHVPANVIASRGSKTLHSKTSNTKENVTILACINAAGTAMPPFCIVKGKTMKSVQSFAVQDAPTDTSWTFQENAWMCDILGEEWFRNVFLPNCGPARPQLLLLDSHSSHEVVELLQLARQENIVIMALPPHTTQELQPLDKVVFGPFKRAYSRICTEFMADNPRKVINKATWPKLFKETWESTMRPELLRKAFEATGIMPFNAGILKDSVSPRSSDDAAHTK